LEEKLVLDGICLAIDNREKVLHLEMYGEMLVEPFKHALSHVFFISEHSCCEMLVGFVLRKKTKLNIFFVTIQCTTKTLTTHAHTQTYLYEHLRRLGRCHGLVTAASIVVHRMSLSVGLRWLSWTKKHKRRHGDVSWFRL
jgi:hypothetical protein